jgi:spore coat protein U-like protein
MTLLKICILTFLFLTTVSAHGLCRLTLASVNTAINLNQNNFPTLDVRVEQQGECGNFYITIDNGGAASYTNRVLKTETTTLPIQFYKDAGRTKILKDEFETSAAEVITGTFAGASTSASGQNFVYYPFVDPAGHQYASVGNFTGNFTIKLFEGSPISNRMVDSKIVNFVYLQNRAVDVSLVETGLPFKASSSTRVLGFGTLRKDATLGADLVLKYNSGYAISMSSLNGGRLKHADAQKYVPYSLKVEGVEKSISTVPKVIKNATGTSPQGGARLPVQVTIGEVSAAPPGSYSDIISITVASHE